MISAAPALDTYQKLVGNANPLGAFVQGTQLRAQLDTIRAKQQADTFQNTLDVLKLAQQRSENQQKMSLANQELDIKRTNAETNRMIALRGLKGSTKATAPAGPVPIFGYDDQGRMTMSFGSPPQDSAAETPQGPTDGQGDGPEVTSLDSSAPSSPRVMPTPNGSGEPSIMSSPLGAADAQQMPTGMAPPTAEPRRAAGAGATTAPKGAGQGRMFVTGYDYNTKTGSTSIHASATPPKRPGDNQVDEAQLAHWKNFAQTWGLTPDKITTDEKGNPQITFGKPDKAKETDFSISNLPAESQKIALPLMTDLANAAEAVRNVMPTDAQKMAAIGVTDPAKMTPDLWKEGFDRAMQKGEVDPAARNQLGLKAREFAAFMNLQYSGKQGYVPTNEASVLSSLGIRPVVPPTQQQQQQDNVPRGTVAGNEPAAPGAPAQQGPLSGKRPQADIDKYEKQIIPQLQQRYNDAAQAKDTQAMQEISGDLQRAKGFLTQMKAQGGTEPTAAPTMESEAKRAQQIKEEKAKPAATGREAKVQENNQKWESKKVSLLRVLNDTGADLQDLNASDSGTPSDMGASGGKPSLVKQSEWLMANREKLKAAGITPKNGGELRSDSVIFTDADGRAVRLGAIMDALLNDPRMKQAQTTTHEAPGGRQVTISVGTPVKVQ